MAEMVEIQKDVEPTIAAAPQSAPDMLREGRDPLVTINTEKDPLPKCWYCRCYNCWCGCLHADSPSCPIRCVDCCVVFHQYRSGMYYPDGKFNRKMCEKLDQRVPAEIDQYTKVLSTDITIPSTFDKDVQIGLRVFDPAPVPDATLRKVMLFIHGGGWVINHNSSVNYHDLANKLARDGNFIVVSIEYRLAPEHPHPKQIYDCYDAAKWLSAATAPVGLPLNADLSDGFIVMGDSAGGHLAMVLSTLARDKVDANLHPDPNAKIRISQQVLVYPALFMGHLLKDHKEPFHWTFLVRPVRDFFTQSFLAGKIGPDAEKIVEEKVLTDRRVCPALAGLHNLPPTVMVSADLDFLKFENLLAVEEMQKHGVEVEHHHYKGEVHGMITLGPLSKNCNKARADIIEDLKTMAAKHQTAAKTTMEAQQPQETGALTIV